MKAVTVEPGRLGSGGLGGGPGPEPARGLGARGIHRGGSVRDGRRNQ